MPREINLEDVYIGEDSLDLLRFDSALIKLKLTENLLNDTRITTSLPLSENSLAIPQNSNFSDITTLRN